MKRFRSFPGSVKSKEEEGQKRQKEKPKDPKQPKAKGRPKRTSAAACVARAVHPVIRKTLKNTRNRSKRLWWGERVLSVSEQNSVRLLSLTASRNGSATTALSATESCDIREVLMRRLGKL